VHPVHDVSPWRRSTTDLRTTVREVLGMLKLLVAPGRDDPSAIYDLLSAHNNLGHRTLYLNLGYWKNAQSYDEACEALALLLAERAELAPGHEVLDAGFGFGDQDLLWARRFGVRITGFNVNAAQHKVATERAAAAGLGDRVDLRLCSVLDTGLASASIDRVLALESAFHFPSRDAFFAEAFRVLKPGGRIALADICNAPSVSSRLADRLTRRMANAFWQIPPANNYDAVEYAARLARAGFVDVQVERLNEHVYAPFAAYAHKRQAEADVVARANPLMRATWRAPANDRVFDYMVFSGRRP
jgi:cyclopropane fatty-acyl-phospholipid synthase-like methyltransferase